MILTHKHRKHFEKEYNTDVYNIIANVIIQKKLTNNVSVIDLTDNFTDIDSVFPTEEVDPASHPHFKYFDTHLANSIVEIINQRLHTLIKD